ncbi:uncharacterized protein LOC110457934 isoform X2 [Mizuhopecten yessoensis]|uniref:uncharacterized protein LOC110457934 isoform X2 n=1 Tax=Mizuhopecten yessoensis TaxID=6573 RepID=UPI000B45C84A|nr:uncharacterized protein LOC110457934 isoform X2 [Mizuhopecten yessoensis]
MSERVRSEEQARVVVTDIGNDLVENIRQICFMMREYFKIKIFMFAACISDEELRGACGGGNRHIGNMYYYDIQENRQFGSLDVYEIQTGGGKLILPVGFQGDDSMHDISNSRFPLDFHSFPNRTDYINTHLLESDFQEVFQREYRNQEVIEDEDDTQSNETESTPMHTGGRRNAGYRRMTMAEVGDVIHSRHDPCTPSMKDIEQRMRTFHGWRLNGNWAADQMAQAGFFRTDMTFTHISGTGNQAECFHCGFCVKEWDEDPLVTHVRWAPRCSFLRDTFPLDVIYGILFNRGRRNAGYPRMTLEEIAHVIDSRHDPCTPSMKGIEQRMRTFREWSLNGKWAAEQMVKAGFFYTGTGNQAECFHCGFCGYEWDEAPLMTHVRWAPRCRFLRDTFPLDVLYGILFNRKQM